MENKKCRNCGVTLVVGENWPFHAFKSRFLKCKECISIFAKKKRSEAQRAGMCTNHTSTPSLSGQTQCQKCINRKSTTLLKGFCARHPTIALTANRKTCDKCSFQARQHDEVARKNGMCISHPKIKRAFGKVMCGVCLSRLRDKAKLKKIQVLEHYGAYCHCQGCTEKQYEFLSIEHLNNDGSVHRRKIRAAGSSLISWIIKNNYPKDLSILCYNCNCSKGFFGYCPHNK